MVFEGTDQKNYQREIGNSVTINGVTIIVGDNALLVSLFSPSWCICDQDQRPKADPCDIIIFSDSTNERMTSITVDNVVCW